LWDIFNRLLFMCMFECHFMACMTSSSFGNVVSLSVFLFFISRGDTLINRRDPIYIPRVPLVEFISRVRLMGTIHLHIKATRNTFPSLCDAVVTSPFIFRLSHSQLSKNRVLLQKISINIRDQDLQTRMVTCSDTAKGFASYLQSTCHSESGSSFDSNAKASKIVSVKNQVFKSDK
jgi:hypothetical protein